ncbi:MAG: TIGR02266 family protein [Polyangiaceae bacterium]
MASDDEMPPRSNISALGGDSWADKRDDDRAAITLRVEYKRLNTFFADYAKNISKGGTFIRTSKPLDIGTEFVFVLTIPNSDKRLELRGRVVWIVRADDATDDNHAGMGIKFQFENDSERKAVEAFVESLMRDALGEALSQKLLAKN